MNQQVSLTSSPRIALVHEWFVALAGSEKVVEQFCSLYPEMDLFSVFAEQEWVEQQGFLRNRNLQTTFIQHLPFASKQFRSYLLLMPLAIEQLDLTPYNVVLSSSHAVAKGVLTGPDQLHISYVHSPIRYAWDLQHQYLREARLTSGAKGWMARWMLHKMRIWDYRTAAGVDCFVANSKFIARRIKKVYGREADVIYPPVDVSNFGLRQDKDSFYLAASRLVPYKRMDLIVEAFAAMPDKRLVVIGDGPERDKLKEKAAPNIELMGYQPFDVLKDMMQRARAFVFAAEEDFGITPVEAQACGTPVIALGRGGAMETVRALGEAQPTGLFFPEQTVAALVEAVKRFEQNQHEFVPASISEAAQRFSEPRFRQEFGAYVERRWAEFKDA